MTNGTSFFDKYREQEAKRFEAWCIENGYDPRKEGMYEEYKAYLSKKAEEEKAEMNRLAEEEKANALRERIATFNASTPPRFKDATLGEITDVKRKLLNGASGLIMGSNGSGKTRLAYALGKEWIQKGESVLIIKAQVLLLKLKQMDDPYKYIDINFRGRVTHLIIDEIDKIYESRADFVYLNYLVDTRYEWLLQTIIIGNGTQESFINSLGQSIFSRLTGDGGIGIDLEGKDRRLENYGA